MIMENEYIYSEEFQSYGDQLKNYLTDYVTLESTVLDGNSVEGEDKATPMGCMQEFFDASLVCDKDTAMKKLFAAGVVMANDAGVLPFDLPDDSPSGVASLVDDSLTRVKVAYEVATGAIPLEEVADTLIDAAASRAMAVADTVLDNPEMSVEIVCNTVSAAFPPIAEVVQFVKPVIKQVVTRIAPKVKEFVCSGINRVSQYAKEVARPIIAKAREIGLKVKNHILKALFG